MNTKTWASWVGLLLICAQLMAVAQTVIGSCLYEIALTINLTTDGPLNSLRVYIRITFPTHPPYQELLSVRYSPSGYALDTDRSGNHYAWWEFLDIPAATSLTLTATFQIRVQKLSFNLDNCGPPISQAKDMQQFLLPERYIESDSPELRSLAAQLASGKRTACEILRAIYDWVGDNICYSKQDLERGAAWAFTHREGDCSEFSYLTIALARAAGIPTRIVWGYTGPSTEEDVNKSHVWVEAFLPGVGWAPLDPTWGRRPVDRNTYFLATTGEHIIAAYKTWARSRSTTDFCSLDWTSSGATNVSCTSILRINRLDR